ncbi:alginate export family protein [Motiliproteus sp.]|uniref:alginate export family protein n=1 Tax=Motiliproteus sp. TaxID=1898955 RepID=UPI003BAB5057
MNKKIKALPLALPLSVLLALGVTPAQAAEIHNQNGNSLQFNVEAMLGVFSLDENYSGTPGSRNWQEGYIKTDLVGESQLDVGTLYGGAGLIALGTRGDGDGLGISTGDEADVDLENLFAGWRSASGVFDISIGRQTFQLGDGFLIAGDKVSPGEGFGDNIDRGGAYYLAGRSSFSNTAIARIDPQGPVRGDLFWLQSDNKYQQKTELAGVNLEWVNDELGTLGVSYFEVTDLEEGTGLSLFDQRKGLEVTSLRGQGSAGVENLFLSFEYVDQSGGDTAVKNDAQGWYVELGYTFADVWGSPSLNYRYAEFSGDDSSTAKNEAFDPLFYGFTRGFGTWYQGEVASNYAGPFSSGNDVSRIELTLSPREDLMIGAQYWKFDKQDDAADLSGDEIDLYALWSINDNWVFSPMIGYYDPKGSDVIAAQGNDDSNLYLQAVLMYFF